MNVLYTADTIASTHFWVVIRKLICPAEPTHLLLLVLWHIFYEACFLELLILTITLDVKVLAWRSELAHFELDASYLDNIISLYSMTIRLQ